MVSKKAAAIPPSATLAVNSKAKEFVAQGHRVVNFSAGQPNFDTPTNICRAAKRAIDKGFTKYTPASGMPELKEAIVEKFKRDNGLEYKVSQVIACAGGKQALFNVIFCLINEGDKVLLPTPAWVSYMDQIKICGGEIVYLKGNKDFKITARQLDKSIKKGVKLLILNYPSNPTGAIYSKSELEELARVIVKRKIWVISDEVYESIVFDGHPHVSIASLGKEIFKRTIVVNAVSKTYSMTGWRIGYAAGDEKVISACGALQSHTTSNPCSIAQAAALEALRGPQGFVKEMVGHFDRRRKLLVKGLNKIKGLEAKMPKGAFYVFVDVSKVTNDSNKFCKELIEKEKVATVPGSAFMAEGFVRLSYAVSDEDIILGLKRIKKFVERKMK